MSRRVSPFTKAEVKRAVDGVRAGGLEIARVEIDPAGKIVIAMKDGQVVTDDEAELEKFRKEHGYS